MHTLSHTNMFSISVKYFSLVLNLFWSSVSFLPNLYSCSLQCYENLIFACFCCKLFVWVIDSGSFLANTPRPLPLPLSQQTYIEIGLVTVLCFFSGVGEGRWGTIQISGWRLMTFSLPLAHLMIKLDLSVHLWTRR